MRLVSWATVVTNHLYEPRKVQQNGFHAVSMSSDIRTVCGRKIGIHNVIRKDVDSYPDDACGTCRKLLAASRRDNYKDARAFGFKG